MSWRVSDEFEEKLKTPFMFNEEFFFLNRAVCEIMWKNRAGQATDDNMAHALFMLDIYGYKHTHYVILVFPLQQWPHDRACMLRYTYIACLIKYCLQSHFIKKPWFVRDGHRA
jgi:hypothetical protein